MQNVDILLEPLRAFLSEVGVFLPRLLLAVAVLAGGWVLAKLARFTTVKALRAVNFGVLAERAGLDGFLRQGGLRHDTAALFALLVYWLVLLAALVVASNSLGLSAIAELLGRVLWFVPRVLVGLVILALGSYFARFIGETVRNAGHSSELQDAELLARVAQAAVQVFVVLTALDHLDIGGTIVQSSFLILLAGLVFAVALAFGLGGRDWAAARIARWLSHEQPPGDDRWR